MKKKILLLILLILVGCSTKQVRNSATSKYCGEEVNDRTCGFNMTADMSSYQDFNTKDNQFVLFNMNAALTMFKEKKSGILYFGFPKCPWCIEALPSLNEAAKEKKQRILYVRTRDDDKKLLYNEEQKKELISYVEQYLKKDDKGNYVIYVPFVVVVKDGKAIAGHVGTVDSHNAKERMMNEKEKVELKRTYDEMFSK